MTDQPTTPEPTDEPDESTQPEESEEYVEPTQDPELPERAEPVEPEPAGDENDNPVSTAEPS